jgi:N-acetylglucosamine-6-phosphate deacetylase
VGADLVEADGLVALPGFLDVHVHGGGGGDVMDASADALRAMLRAHAQHGTTGLLATTLTQSQAAVQAALENARAAHAQGHAFCPDGAAVLGIHLEGPYINPARPGAQPREHVRDYDAEEFAGWLESAGGSLVRITLAPERPGADGLLGVCRAEGIVVSLGHTDATAAQIVDALDGGPCDATHLFNAMPGLHHREPGPVAIFLTDPRAAVELICDGHHVAPDVIRLVVAAKGTDGVIAITDAMAAAGVGDGTFSLGGHPVEVRNGRATLPDGTLASSVVTMEQTAANLRRWCELDWSDVARLTSTNAARRMGWSRKGRLAVGCDADLVLVDEQVAVHATFVGGRQVHARDDRARDERRPLIDAERR